MTTVRLCQAFLWTCEDCGRDNFERAIEMDREMEGELPPDLVELAREWTEVGGSASAFLIGPQRVTCRHCAAEFEAEG